MRLSDLNARLEAEGLCFPVDLGADPMIGGMVATNTGGARFLRYGDVRANTLGLTVVLPDADGTVLRLDRALRKDNTGPDWKHLFIGTSGAFGIVTECVLNVEPLPRERATAVLVPRDEVAIFDLLRQLETRLGTDLSAFEFMSGNAMRHALAHAPSVRNPFSDGDIPPIALLVEIARTAPASEGEPTLAEVLERTLADIWEQADEPLTDALFGPPEELWPLRHALSEGVKHAGRLFAFDLAFARTGVMRFRASMTQRLAADWPELEVCDFGHVGDGGIHFNLVCHDRERCQSEGYEQKLRDAVVQQAVEDFGGSFSGEHAIGRANQRYYDRYTPDALKTLADRFSEALGLQATGAARFGHEHDKD
jgi:FAD/FMN-containing dehydrogenase